MAGVTYVVQYGYHLLIVWDRLVVIYPGERMSNVTLNERSLAMGSDRTCNLDARANSSSICCHSCLFSSNATLNDSIFLSRNCMSL